MAQKNQKKKKSSAAQTRKKAARIGNPEKASELLKTAEPENVSSIERHVRTMKDVQFAQEIPTNPVWFLPLMTALFVIGLLFLVIFTMTGGDYPILDWGMNNIYAGFAFIIVAFFMTTQWKS
jgi:hypothetical protein